MPIVSHIRINRTMESNDTLFIRNLSFDMEQDQLKEFFEENFGETVYCLICKDKETGESKGTAFVKFKEAENAEKCLSEFRDMDLVTKFNLNGRNLMILPALSRDKVQEIKQHATTKHKDKRNLHLARENFIKPNSEEAEGVSKSDMEKRKLLEMRKREKLKNLHNFVSDVRLCIHNLPQSVDDAKLRQIFLKSVKEKHPNAKLVECKVMRNKQKNGKLGTSKGFAFVAFSKHEHSLAALKNLNNNPNIFSKDKRPIVEFSIENLVAINKKKTRLARSQQKAALKQQTQTNEKPKVPDEKTKETKKTKQKKITQKKPM